MSLNTKQIRRIVVKARKYRVTNLPDTIIYSDGVLDGLGVVQNLIGSILNKKVTTIAMEQNGFLKEAQELNRMTNSQYLSFLETYFSKRSGRLPV